MTRMPQDRIVDVARHLQVVVTEAAENLARLRIESAPGPTGEPSPIREISGVIYGPRCAFARTLPAAYRLSSERAAGAGAPAASTAIPEPTFWTPELPFLYEAQLQLRLDDGQSPSWSHTLGLRRFEIHGPNFLAERRRIVLRGVACRTADRATLSEARGAGAALLIAPPSCDILQCADELGVRLLLDGRRADGEPAAVGGTYSWHPSVHGVTTATASGMLQPGAAAAGEFINVESVEPLATRWGANFLAVELRPGQTPPSWVARFGRPVVAIRLGGDVRSVEAARRACDDLQAELAPAMDLAGYFVGP